MHGVADGMHGLIHDIHRSIYLSSRRAFRRVRAINENAYIQFRLRTLIVNMHIHAAPLEHHILLRLSISVVSIHAAPPGHLDSENGIHTVPPEYLDRKKVHTCSSARVR